MIVFGVTPQTTCVSATEATSSSSENSAALGGAAKTESSTALISHSSSSSSASSGSCPMRRGLLMLALPAITSRMYCSLTMGTSMAVALFHFEVPSAAASATSSVVFPVTLLLHLPEFIRINLVNSRLVTDNAPVWQITCPFSADPPSSSSSLSSSSLSTVCLPAAFLATIAGATTGALGCENCWRWCLLVRRHSAPKGHICFPSTDVSSSPDVLAVNAAALTAADGAAAAVAFDRFGLAGFFGLTAAFFLRLLFCFVGAHSTPSSTSSSLLLELNSSSLDW
mmetsp:Transcript_21865/g.85687  ORF Transcript_21865/g.85687 Transcript_21865/m.85687 type:complete len:282 (+) Transcript_21865:3430-4275(+)